MLLTGAADRGTLSIGTGDIKGSYQVTKVTTFKNGTFDDNKGSGRKRCSFFNWGDIWRDGMGD